jgi:hypothetical protein
MTDWAQAVRAASEILIAEPGLEDDDVVTRLEERGLSEAEARIAATFVPVAFGRVLLSERGITRLSGAFYVLDDDGKWIAFELGEQPAFEEATRLAVTARHRGTIERAAYDRIASRSAEVGAAHEAPAALALPGVPPSMFAKAKPWWRFW